jgi:adenylyltransferase/sulfurtransferase
LKFFRNIKQQKLSSGELEQYSRQIIIDEIGEEGQLKLKNAKVLIIGAGGLGSPAAEYLARCGIGNIGIIDFDNVALSNLHRQTLFSFNDLGKPKAVTARNKLIKINPNITVTAYTEKLNKDTAIELFSKYDLIADGTDNFAAKYLINDVCVMLNKPFAYGSILKFEGQVSFFIPNSGPCYRCLFPEPPPIGEIPSCNEAGVIGVLPGIIGSLQANEIIKYILQIGNLLTGRLLTIDALNLKFSQFIFSKDPICAACSENSDIKSLPDYEHLCSNSNNDFENNEFGSNDFEITVEEYFNKINSGKNIFLLDIREHYETKISSIGGYHIPMRELSQRLDELPSDKNTEIVVYCRTGHRSHNIVQFLKNNAGYKNVKNLIGGIYAWNEKIDPSVKKY